MLLNIIFQYVWQPVIIHRILIGYEAKLEMKLLPFFRYLAWCRPVWRPGCTIPGASRTALMKTRCWAFYPSRWGLILPYRFTTQLYLRLGSSTLKKFVCINLYVYYVIEKDRQTDTEYRLASLLKIIKTSDYILQDFKPLMWGNTC